VRVEQSGAAARVPSGAKTGEVTFYLSLPASTAGLDQAATKAAMPGSSAHRHFISLAAVITYGLPARTPRRAASLGHRCAAEQCAGV
jgi:hypothetical protein